MQNHSNKLFYIAYAIMVLNASLIKNIDITVSKFIIITYIILFMINTVLKRYSIKEFIIIHIGIILSLIILMKSKDVDIFIMIIVILSTAGINFRKVVKIDFFIRLLGVSFTILLSTIGITKDFIMYRFEDISNIAKIRHSLGFIHPNTLSVNIFILLLGYLFLRYKKIRNREYILIFLIMYIFGEITGSRTGSISIALTIFILIINKNTKLLDRKGIKTVITYSVVVCTIASLSLAIFYNYDLKFVNELNYMLTGRIKSANYFIDTYGFSILGQQIKLVSIIQSQQSYEQMRILDNLYVSLAVRSGIVLLVIYNYLYIKLNKWLLKNNYKNETIFITIMTIYGLIEKVPISPELNFTALLLGLVIYNKSFNKEELD